MTATMPRYRRHPDVLWRRSLDAVLVLPHAGREPLTLGGAGPEIWVLLGVPWSLDDLVTHLSEGHAADRDVIAADVGRLLQQLTELGLVEAIT
jgi:hypothetical protein